MRGFALMLSLAFVFMIPWENGITLGGFGTLTRVVGILMALVWLYSVPKTGFRKPHPFHWIVFLFILWNTASFFWSVEVDETLRRIGTYLQLALLNYILWDLYTTPRTLRAAMEAYVLGAYVAVGSTIYNFSVGQTISKYSEGRYAGAGMNAVDLSLVLVLGLPVAWHLAISASNEKKDYFLTFINYLYIPVSLFAVILTGSRTVIFIVVPAILYIVATANKIRPLIKIYLFVVFLGFIVATGHYIQDSTIKRLASVNESIIERDFGGRVTKWEYSIETFSKNPLLGIGSGTLQSSSKFGIVSHNTFLSILAEIGLIGFSLFIVILTIVVYQTMNQAKSLSGLWLTVLIIWTMGVCTLTWEYTKPTWLFLTLIVISANLFKDANSITETQLISIDQFD